MCLSYCSHMLQPASCALNTADRGRDADMQVMFGDVVQYSEKALTSVFPFRECLIESMKRRHLKFRCLTGTQCSGADCVLIFLGAAPCTAPKFYIFTKANMCVNCSVQCAAQRRHQTISLWAVTDRRFKDLWDATLHCYIKLPVGDFFFSRTLNIACACRSGKMWYTFPVGFRPTFLSPA